MHSLRSGRVGATAARLTAVVALALVASTFGGLVGVPAADAAGPYGPDTCLWGYVWREARPSDHVCVTPATRSQTWTDNSLAALRRSPTGGTYGPDTCLAGYVWREAFQGDHVCVPPATRSQAAADNVQVPARRAMDPLDLEFLGFPDPGDCVWGNASNLSMSPDGSFSLRGTLSNDDDTVGGGGLGDLCRPGSQATVICAVALLDHSALWLNYSVWLPSHKLYGVPRHQFDQSGTSALIAQNWTKIPRRGAFVAEGWWDQGTDVLCGLANTARTADEVRAHIRDRFGITGPAITIT